MPPVLEVAGLTVRLPPGSDRANAVEGVSLEVGSDETLCLVGESGSGKSVAAQAVMGLLPKPHLAVSAGRAALLGEELTTARPARLRALRGARMAMIFQEPMTALNPVMTIGRQIEEALAAHAAMPLRVRAERARAALRDASLPDPGRIAAAFPHQLSGGQRQRAMIAMALALRPALLIADEPTTALDVTTQAQILALLRRLQRERGMGILFITHDFGVVAEIADRVAVMREGRIVESGPAEKVLSAPEHPYTRRLTAAVPSLSPPERGGAPAGEVALETRALSKTYATGHWPGRRRKVEAARDVDIFVRRGETLGVVGESGSGKSTLARCVLRLVEPDSGAVLLDGVDLAPLSPRALRPWRRRVQIVFQDPYRSLNPRRAVGSSVAEGPMNYGVDAGEARRRARELLELVGIDPAAAGRYPHQFSGGQRQRICIARALAMEPEVLVADEAVSALDVSVQAQVLALLDRVRVRFRLAMLFITHDLRVAARICDRVAVMFRGEVVETGPAADIFAAPRHEYTRRLFAAIPGRGRRFGSGPE